MATIPYSFPLFRQPICTQDANTKAQMGTARQCLEQITNIKAIARRVKRILQAISKLEFIYEQTWIELKSDLTWIPKSPSKGPQEDLAGARNAHAERREVFAHVYRDLSEAQDKAYFEILDRMREADTTLQLERDELKRSKPFLIKALSSLKTAPPTLQGRCIETICGALLPICTETDLESLPIPEALRSDIAAFCDCLYLIQDEQFYLYDLGEL